MNYRVNTTDELYHHGVLGQRWGVRRYQNKDGSLTLRGKRLQKKYRESIDKANMDYQKREDDVVVKSWNKANDKIKKTGFYDKFNSDMEKKYGKDVYLRDEMDETVMNEYYKRYNPLFDKEYTKAYTKEFVKTYTASENYKKAQKLVEKYDMTSWSDLAKTNAENMAKYQSKKK